jgi:hypothetical protein
VTSTENKPAPREFWIDIEALNFDWRVRVTEESKFPVNPNCLHVIEKSAFDQLQKKNEELKETISYLPKVPAQPYEKELAQQLAEAKRELEEEEKACLKLIDERDNREEQLSEIADILGDETEWSSRNDRGFNAIELSHLLKSQCAKLVDALRFYANKDNYKLVAEVRDYFVEYKCCEVRPETMHDDELGTLARKVLAEIGELK